MGLKHPKEVIKMVENKTEQKQKQEIQGKIQKIEINAVEIIKEQPIYRLHYNDWGSDYYDYIYIEDLKNKEIGDYFGDLTHGMVSQRLTKIAEIPAGDLYLLETKEYSDAENYSIKRELIIFRLH